MPRPGLSNPKDLISFGIFEPGSLPFFAYSIKLERAK